MTATDIMFGLAAILTALSTINLVITWRARVAALKAAQSIEAAANKISGMVDSADAADAVWSPTTVFDTPIDDA